MSDIPIFSLRDENAGMRDAKPGSTPADAAVRLQ